MMIDLDKKFFMGGNATFTVDNGKGLHYTFKINQPKKQNPRFTGPSPHFASLLTGPDNTSSYTYLGKVEDVPVMESKEVEPGKVVQVNTGRRTLIMTLTKNSRMNDDSQPVRVLRWALAKVASGGQLPEGYAIHHEGNIDQEQQDE